MENQNNKAAFLGKVTASVTHEIQNVLAIIKETAGLMEDFLLMNQTGELSDIEDRLGKCIKTIKNQSYRGVNLTSGLNGFAHTTDNFQTSLNIFDACKKLFSITERLFTQKGANVTLIENKKPCSILTDPVLFQMVLLLCIECLIENFEINAPITLVVHSSDDLTAIEFSYNDNTLKYEDYRQKITHDPEWLKIINLCKQLNFTAKITDNAPGILINLK